MLSIFNKLNLLGLELDAVWKQSEVTGTNIANAEVPGYKAKKLRFESVLGSMLDTSGNKMKATRAGHSDGRVKYSSPVITVDYGTSMRLDGNNVDVENEMVQLADSNIKYGFLVQKASKEISKIRYAINEGRR
ncbi:MAG: flagellar basal body rod protein FlgB [Clostridiales bacterium]|nr:flagellar basal body rod protein FlgB [Clostridiales bacterium]